VTSLTSSPARAQEAAPLAVLALRAMRRRSAHTPFAVLPALPSVLLLAQCWALWVALWVLLLAPPWVRLWVAA